MFDNLVVPNKLEFGHVAYFLGRQFYQVTPFPPHGTHDAGPLRRLWNGQPSYRCDGLPTVPSRDCSKSMPVETS
jgi:hypothetical protein